MANKPLYVISIVSEMLELHPQTLRQYERMGLVTPSRTVGNTRLYSDEDIERLKFIMTLSKDMGVNLAGIEIILNMREQIETLHAQLEGMKEYVRQRMGEEMKAKEAEKALIPSPPKEIIKIKIEKE
ncbi:helix-turn-helix transcriptional regulator [Geovibrio sp. ADMFC3]|jgi:MerR family transcriptional regulator/heat shock protein HspR